MNYKRFWKKLLGFSPGDRVRLLEGGYAVDGGSGTVIRKERQRYIIEIDEETQREIYKSYLKGFTLGYREKDLEPLSEERERLKVTK